MSREYDIYCKNCETYRARKNYIRENKKGFSQYLFQCLGCGRVWMETRVVKELFIGSGSSEEKQEKDWKRGDNLVWREE
jgi:uncharacterized Zn finger protein